MNYMYEWPTKWVIVLLTPETVYTMVIHCEVFVDKLFALCSIIAIVQNALLTFLRTLLPNWTDLLEGNRSVKIDWFPFPRICMQCSGNQSIYVYKLHPWIIHCYSATNTAINTNTHNRASKSCAGSLNVWSARGYWRHCSLCVFHGLLIIDGFIELNRGLSAQ